MEITLSTIIISIFLGTMIVYNFYRKSKLLIKAEISKLVYPLMMIVIVLILLNYYYFKNIHLSSVASIGLALFWIMSTSNGIVEGGIQIYKNPNIFLKVEKWDNINSVEIKEEELIRLKYDGKRTYNTLFFKVEDKDELMKLIKENIDEKRIDFK